MQSLCHAKPRLEPCEAFAKRSRGWSRAKPQPSEAEVEPREDEPREAEVETREDEPREAIAMQAEEPKPKLASRAEAPSQAEARAVGLKLVEAPSPAKPKPSKGSDFIPFVPLLFSLRYFCRAKHAVGARLLGRRLRQAAEKEKAPIQSSTQESENAHRGERVPI